MKAKLLQNRESGSVLMVTMVIIFIVGLTLASFLSLIGAQNKSVVRSQVWNATIPIVEAGIEEAIVHLNTSCLTNDITQATLDWNADGWTTVTDGYQMIRTNGTTWYKVLIVTTSPYSKAAPAIVSQGYLPAPLSSLAPQTMFAVIGNVVSQPTYVGRKVKVTTSQDGIFVKGMVAKESLDLSGNRISTDSFDSMDPAHSTSGLYDITKRKDNGDVAVNSKLLDSLNIGNADIRGRVSTGPGGLVSIGPNGGVGDAAWIDSGTDGVQAGHFSDDMNVSFQDVLVPFTTGYTTPTGGKATNIVITLAGVSVTTANLPTNAVSVVTNTVVANSTNYPDPNTYVGNVTTNQYPVISTNLAGAVSATYPTNAVGTITTNTTYVTSLSAPIVGTYTGNVTTNTSSTNTVAAPVAGTYLGSVTTNTVSTNTVAVPVSGTYLGSVTTNTSTTTTLTVPVVGTYIGNVTTNSISTNTVGIPGSGTYSGSITTNTVSTNTVAAPASGTYVGNVTTNTVSTNTVAAPASGTYLGSVTTNTVSTNTVAAPASGTYLGSVTTNTVSTNTVAAPAVGTYVGNVTTNSVSTNTVAAPASGTYLGSVTTNTVSTNTVAAPVSGTYVGSVTTNTVSTNTVAAPASGTYVGAVTTNTTVQTISGTNLPAAGTYTTIISTNTTQQHAGNGNAPAAGTYIPGSLVISYGSDGKITGYDYLNIDGYTYNKISSYTYNKISSYTYNKISSYTYNKISSYTYNQISSYAYNKISSYAYNKISSYAYSLIIGYSSDQLSYTYAKIIDYTYAKIIGYTYNTIIGYASYQINTYSYTFISGYTTNYVTGSYTYNRKTGYTYPSTVATTNEVVTTYDYILNDGDYLLGNLSGSVFVQGRARLYVTDDINITGQDSITLGSGGGLKLYTSAPTVSIAGKGVINNGGNAMDFAYFGLPSNTKLNYTGNSSFTGTIYAPSAAFKLGGGGNDTYDFIGASVTKTVDMNGHYNFHYDENLGRVALARGYVIKSWVEISLSQVK